MSQTRSQLGPLAQRTAEALLSGIDGTASAVIATIDGFSLAHAGGRSIDPARLAAVVSSMTALADAASRETGIGTPRCFAVDSSDGRMVMRCFDVAGESIIAVLLTETRVLMGMVLNRLGDAERLMNAA